MDTLLTPILDRFERLLPAVPRRAFKLNRTLTAAGFETLTASATTFCAASKTATERAPIGAKTVAGQAGSVAQRVESTVKNGAKEVAGQARAQANDTLDLVEDETLDILDAAGGEIEDSLESSYEKHTKSELYGLAQEFEIDGRSSMTKSELITALRTSR